MSADRLPTAQIDGVVWSQAIVGNTVYAGGRFNNARPAGAAAGTNLTPRGNLLAFDVTTGNLISTFAPTLNGQVLSVAASPNGSRIYVVGDFTTANGQARRRVAAYSTATGQLDPTFNPVGVSSQARAVIATDTTVYVGGGFQTLGDGQSRRNLAAFNATTGAVLPWNPNADYTVWALGVSADGQSVFAGGSFQNVGGQAAYGLAKISGASGALDTTWRPSVRNAGPDAGITSLRVQNGFVYGTSWHFGPGGNLEGTFKIPVANGNTEWVTDCHGDNYSTFVTNGIVYSAAHAHYCGNMGGGFPQYTTATGASAWRFQHAQAWSDTVTGEILNEVHGYTNWHGNEPGPAMVNWLPDMGIGSFTGQYQAGWSVIGNNDYVAFGGEFPTVNGAGQQGLVRFARRSIAPRREGPRFVNGSVTPTLVPVSTSAVRVTWPAGFDRDDRTLTYRVVRDGVTLTSQTAESNWWTLPALGVVDTGLTPGQTYSYRIVITDPDGNTVNGAQATVTMPASFATSTGYAQRVRSNGARIYWPLNETTGPTARDRAATANSAPRVGVTDGSADASVSWNQPGAITGDSAVSLVENDTSRISGAGTETAPDTFTSQVWIRTSSTRGGRILGFSDLQTGTSGHRDRHLYMLNTGRIVFGVRAQDNSRSIISTSSLTPYNDNRWHMLTATMSSAGMRLYVDGQLAGQNTTTQGEAYLGYWRLGGDNLDGWDARPTTRNFTGSVDEVAVYPTALTASQILAQYQLRDAPPPGNQAPTAAFTSTTAGLTAAFNGSGSADPDGSISSYAWNFGDGTSGSGATPSRTYAAAGTYNVTLTVTDNAGATGSVTQPVTVAAADPQVVATDAFDRTVANGWGSADVGGPWTLTTSSTNFNVGSGVGTARMAASSGPSATLGSVSTINADLTMRFSYDQAGSGGGIYTSAVLRRIGTSDYRAKLRVNAGDTILYLTRTVNGAETTLASQAISGLVVGSGDVINLRFQAEGSGTTALRGRVWRAGTTEPTTWTATITDSTAALQSPGAVGIVNYLSGTATAVPVTISVQDFAVRQLP